MGKAAADSVTFSDLSRNPRIVLERARQLGKVRITHRDAPDFYLTAADREESREHSLSVSAHIFDALMKREAGVRVVRLALPDVFPWIRHLSEIEVDEFARELFAALMDVAELDVDTNVDEVVAGWRATARIKADKSQYAHAQQETNGDFGTVEVRA